jgi:hypothetical protein
MPFFGGEVKPSVPCRRFAACKKTHAIYVEVVIAGKIDRPFLAQFRPSLTEVSHVAWRGAPLEMTDGTKGGEQRASSLRPRCFGEVDPETATHIYLSIYLSVCLSMKCAGLFVATWIWNVGGDNCHSYTHSIIE